MNNPAPFPNGKIFTPGDVGRNVRACRAEQGITQAELASLCGVGVRFVSELENGKSTAELGKVLQVLKCLGLELSVRRRGWGAPADNS